MGETINTLQAQVVALSEQVDALQAEKVSVRKVGRKPAARKAIRATL